MDYRNTLMWEELNQAPSVIAECVRNNKSVIAEIAKLFDTNKIKNIYAVARGTSNHALTYFKYASEILSGIPVTLGAMSVVTVYEGKLNLNGSLVIGCSQSGKAVDVCEILKRANSQGAITVAITNYSDSPMAKEAKFHINLSAGEEKSVAATKTFTCQLTALLLLAAEIAKRTDIAKQIDSLSQDILSNIKLIDQVSSDALAKFGAIKDGFVLGRGLAYPVALESALKLQETSYITVKAYATSDFFHGPMAMVCKDTPIIIYAPYYGGSEENVRQNVFNDEVIGIDKMLSLDAKVLLVTDCTVLAERYKNSCEIALLPPSDSQYLSALKCVLFAQMFANKVSCSIGNNPDSPRALKKVTITK